MSSHNFYSVCPNCGSEQMNVCFDSRDGTSSDCIDCGYRQYMEVTEEIMNKETYKSWYESWFTEEEIKHNSDNEEFMKGYERYKKVLKSLSDKPKILRNYTHG